MEKIRGVAAKLTAVFLCIIIAAVFFPGENMTVFAAPTGTVVSVNTWGDGGIITVNLSDVGDCSQVTVAVTFSGTVTGAAGWGIVSCDISGNTGNGNGNCGISQIQ